jgi:hypothetical protein
MAAVCPVLRKAARGAQRPYKAGRIAKAPTERRKA